MSNLTLTGFPSGAVDASLDGDSGLIASVAGTVFRGDDSRWTPSPDFSGASVKATRTACYTGEGIAFRVEGMNTDAILFCDYEWDFGGDDYTFDTLTGSGLWATSSGTAQGPFVGHTFRTAAPFVVRVRVYDHTRAEVFTDIVQITVADAATLPTIYYDPGAISASAAVTEALLEHGLTIAEADMRVGSFEAALSEASGNGTKTRLLIESGSSLEIDRTVERNLDNVYLDVYGGNGRATITSTYAYEADIPAGENAGLIAFKVTGAYVTVRNVYIQGSYNSITPPQYAPWIQGSHGIQAIQSADNKDHLTIDDCQIDGFDVGFATDKHGPMAFVVSDTTFHHWYTYAGFAAEIERSAIVGCRMEQLAGTIEHPRRDGTDATPDRVTNLSDNDWHTNLAALGSGLYATAVGGCFRNSKWIKEFGVHQVYAISRSGWSDASGEWSGVAPADHQGKRRAAIQPCFRLTSGQDSIASNNMQGLTSFSFWQTHGKGGEIVYTMTPTDAQPYTDAFILAHGYVWSQCLAEGGWDTRQSWRTVHGNTALRSCLGVMKDHVEWAGAEERWNIDNPSAAIEILTNDDDGTPERNHDDVKAPVWALGCTFANELPREQFWGFESGVRPLHKRGCLALTGDMAPLERINGTPDRPTGMVTAGAVLGSTVATVPGPGASVLGDGFEFAPRRDVAGNLRPAQAAAGAYEG